MGQLFSKKNKEVFSAPLGIDNPVTVQVLGICSALAVTAKLEPAIVMGLSVTVITAFANVVISLLRIGNDQTYINRELYTYIVCKRFQNFTNDGNQSSNHYQLNSSANCSVRELCLVSIS